MRASPVGALAAGDPVVQAVGGAAMSVASSNPSLTHGVAVREGEALVAAHVDADLVAAHGDPELRRGALEDDPLDGALEHVLVGPGRRAVDDADVLRAHVGKHRVPRGERVMGPAAQRVAGGRDHDPGVLAGALGPGDGRRRGRCWRR